MEMGSQIIDTFPYNKFLICLIRDGISVKVNRRWAVGFSKAHEERDLDSIDCFTKFTASEVEAFSQQLFWDPHFNEELSTL